MNAGPKTIAAYSWLNWKHDMVGHIVTNGDDMIKDVSPTSKSISAYSADEAIRQRLLLLKSGAQDHSFYAGLWASLKKGFSFRGVFVNRHKNGLLFHEDKTISPIEDRTGTITHYVSTGRPVSKRSAPEHLPRDLSHYDALTGLPNRQSFLKQLEEFIGQKDQGHTGLLARELSVAAIDDPPYPNPFVAAESSGRARCQFFRGKR